METASRSHPRFCHVCGAQIVPGRRSCLRCSTVVINVRGRTSPGGLPVDALAVGVTVDDRYVIESAESAGRLHLCYRAYDKLFERTVGLRTLRDREHNATRHGELRRQARISNALRHPNILDTFDFVRDDRQGVAAIVEEYVGWYTLRDWLKYGAVVALPYSIYRELMLPLVSALAYAHRHGVVHRNLKPRKILLDRFERPRISDFGLAVYSKPSSKDFAAIVGTLEYLAPEQAEHSTSAEPSGDIYALGVIFYELVAQTLPIQGANDIEFLNKLLNSAPTPLVQVAPHVLPGLDAIIMRCLEKRPEDRFSSMEALYCELADVLGAPRCSR